jgi:hypothetical protein
MYSSIISQSFFSLRSEKFYEDEQDIITAQNKKHVLIKLSDILQILLK